MLLTGGAGGIGRRLVPALRERGWRVRCLEHRTPVADADEAVAGDLISGAGLAEAARGAACVMHAAAITHARFARSYIRANVEGTRSLLAACQAAGVQRLVHVSTRAISPTGGAYSRSKFEAETLVREADLPFVIVRLPEVYGTGGREGVDRLLSLAERGRPVPVLGDGSDLLCPLHVDDAVAALAAALRSTPALGRTYTLGGDCLTALDLARACVAARGSRSSIRRVPLTLIRAGALLSRLAPLPLYPDQVARLRAPKPPLSPEAGPDLEFNPRPLLEGLRLDAVARD